MTFPADQDLAPKDVSITTVIGSERTGKQARTIVENMRRAYGQPCDLIVMAVPRGKGMPFAEGLKLALEQRGQLQS